MDGEENFFDAEQNRAGCFINQKQQVLRKGSIFSIRATKKNCDLTYFQHVKVLINKDS